MKKNPNTTNPRPAPWLAKQDEGSRARGGHHNHNEKDRKSNSESLLSAALHYAARGWHVFPCRPREKIPLTHHGCRDASADPKTIEAWWKRWPSANIGLQCGPESGIYVIDVDVDAEKGVDGWKSIKQEGWELPPTVRQDTPTGGGHFLFKADQAPDNKNNFRNGIDIRGRNYYIILAPSVHPQGGEYKWADGADPDSIELAEYPDFARPEKEKTVAPWLKVDNRPTPAKKPAPKPATPASASAPGTPVIERARLYLRECKPAIQGHGGHDALLWAARAMVTGFELDDATALSLLENEFNPRCTPPWDLSNKSEARDFRRKVKEARRTLSQKPTGWLLKKYGLQDTDEELAYGAKLAESLLVSSGVAPALPRPTVPCAPNVRDPIECLEVLTLADLQRPAPNDPSELLKSRFLCRSGAALLVGPSGIGKSSFVVQAALMWSVGKPMLGIEPNGPLRIMIIQAENDDGDMAEMRDGVLHAMKAEGLFTQEQCREAVKSVHHIRATTLMGENVGRALRRHAQAVDIVILDPVFSYMNGDVMNARDVSHFLREIIAPVIDDLGIGLLLIHHTNKPLRGIEKENYRGRDFAYLGAGSAELTNWPRGVIAIRSIGQESMFELRAPKRGGRLGWTDETGNAVTKKYIGHSSTGICWREVAESEVPTTGEAEPSKTPSYTAFREEAIEIALSKVWKVGELKAEFVAKFKLSDNKADKLFALIREAEEVLYTRGPNKGTSPTHLIGPEEQVRAEAERLQAEKEKMRQEKLI